MRDVKVTYLIFVATFAGLGTYIYGYDVGVTAGSLQQTTFIERFKPSSAITGAIPALFQAGAFFGAATAGYFCDKVGRKRTISIGAILAIIGYTLQCSAFTIAQFLVGRVFAGAGCGYFATVVHLYNAEISPPQVRGFIVGIGGVMNGVGYVPGQWISYGCSFFNDEKQWRLAIGLQIVPALILAIGVHFLPFSPRWLMEKGREEEARKTIQRLHRPKDGNTHDAEAAFIKMKGYIEAEYVKGRLSDLIATPAMRRRTFVACSATIFNQLTGISVTSYYGPGIYKSLGFVGNRILMMQGIYGSIAVVANAIFAVFILDQIGRRKPLIAGNFGMVVIFSVLSALVSEFPTGSGNRAAQYASVVMIFAVPVVFSMSYDPTSSLLASEVFPTHVRSIGMATAVCCNWAVGIILLEVAPIALDHIGWKFYMVFIVLNVIAMGIVYAFFPETKGKSLEDIAEFFGDKPEEVAAQVRQKELAIERGHSTTPNSDEKYDLP